MMKLKSKLASSKVVYVIAISMAVIGILFLTGKLFSRVEMSKNSVIPTQEIQVANSKSAKTNKKATKNTSKKKTTKKKSSKKTTKKTAKKKSSKTTKKTSNKKATKAATKTSKKTAKKSSKAKVTSRASLESRTSSVKNAENKKSATTTPISKVKISKSMNLTKRTGLSREDFIKLISRVKADSSGFFEKNAGKIYDLCEKYSINEIFFCGLISAESGWNIASNHRKTHNYISLMSGGKLIKYDSVNEGLEIAAKKLHYNYLTPGGKFYHGKTLAGVKTCFCPSSGWVNLVYGRMQQIL